MRIFCIPFVVDIYLLMSALTNEISPERKAFTQVIFVYW